MSGAQDPTAPLSGRGSTTPHQGVTREKPWTADVLCVVPHLQTPEPLAVCVAALRAQSCQPQVLVIDTGSTWDVIGTLETLRGEGVEISYIRSHGYQTAFEPVCVAMDLAFALCRCEHLYATHADCFPVRRDWVEDLRRRCDERTPAVGYGMTDRSWATSDWSWMIGHSAAMFHMPTLRRLGISWSYQRWVDGVGHPTPQIGWPDTETGFNYALQAAGIRPTILGTERNWERHLDGNIDHVRSAASFGLTGTGDAWRRAQAVQMEHAVAEARDRTARWRTGVN
jgi:hypothetical protein